MRRTALALVMAATMVAAAANAQAPPPSSPQQTPRQTPRDMIEEGAQLILKAFELMIQAIPEYEAPEVLENGDIIIRRKKPLPPPQPAPGDGPAKT